MDASDDETAAGTRRCSLSCQVWLWEGQIYIHTYIRLFHVPKGLFREIYNTQ